MNDEEDIINNPDGIEDINGKWHYYDDSDAIPFVYKPKDGQFYISFVSNGSTHRDMLRFDFDMERNEIDDLIQNACCGRYWKSVNTFAVWRWDANMVKRIGQLLVQHLGNPALLKTLNVAAPNQMIKFDELVNGKSQHKVNQDELDKMQAIHLMNADDKHKAMNGYITDRSANIGKKLSYSNGRGEMPMAQYRALHSTSESKQRRLHEKVNYVFGQLLNENRESKNLSKARNYIRQIRPQANAQQMVDTIRTDIPNSRIADCKFLMGIARMVLNNELTDQAVVANLNKTLKYIGSDAHVNEYDNNLNDETAATLIQRFAGAAQQDLNDRKNQIDQEEYQINHRYTIKPIDNFEEASQYDFTDWCVTHYPDMFNQYTHGGTGRFYFCLRDDYQTVEEKEGENCPLDDFGLSMIAVSVNDDGSVNTITCRWNHENGGSDNVMTDQELSRVIGRNFYQTFKPYTPEELEQKKQYILDEFTDFISNYGNDEFVMSYFDLMEPVEEDDNDDRRFYVVRSHDFPELAETIGDVFMVFNQDLEPIINDFFEDTYDFMPCETSDTLCIGVCKNRHWNVLKPDGTLLIPGSPNAWPVRVHDASVSTGDYVECTFQDGSMSFIRLADGKPVLEHIRDIQYWEEGAGFLSYDVKTYFFYNLALNQVLIKDIRMPEGINRDNPLAINGATTSACMRGHVSPLQPVNSQNKYLYYRTKDNRLILLSKLPFTQVLNKRGENYEVADAQGKHFFIKTTLDNPGAYDMDYNRIEPQQQSNESRRQIIDRIIQETISRHFQ